MDLGLLVVGFFRCCCFGGLRCVCVCVGGEFLVVFVFVVVVVCFCLLFLFFFSFSFALRIKLFCFVLKKWPRLLLFLSPISSPIR